MCFYSVINETDEKDLFDLSMKKLCGESLRFSPLEQVVYVTSEGNTSELCFVGQFC